MSSAIVFLGFAFPDKVSLATALLQEVPVDKDPGPRAPEHLQRQQTLRRAILKYCVAHPDAKDTIEGILRWWFTAGEFVWRIEEVKAALDDMKAQGWITGRKLQHSNEIYGISKGKLAEIQDFLRRSAGLPKQPPT